MSKYFSAGRRPRPSPYLTIMDAAATLATRLRRDMMSPLSSGCTRLVRKMTVVPVSGSIQMDVPVYPECPNDRHPKRSPLTVA